MTAIDTAQRKLYLWMMPLTYFKILIMILFCYGLMVVADFGIHRVQSMFMTVDNGDAPFTFFLNQFTPDMLGIFKAVMFGQLALIFFIIKKKPQWFDSGKRTKGYRA